MIVARRKQLPVIATLIAVIAVSAWWITRNLIQPKFNVKLHQGIGQTMAEETEKLIAGKGAIVLITLASKQSPVLDVQVNAFQKAIHRHGGISVIETVTLNAAQKAGPGQGLSVDEFLALLERPAKADAIVSFVGTPDPRDPKISNRGKTAGPKIVAETRTRGKIKTLFRNQLLHTAIVPRYEFPAPGTKNPSTPREWFDLSFQVVRSNKPPPEE